MIPQDLVGFLALNNIGTESVDLFYGDLKEFYPDKVTVIRPSGGLATEPNMGDGGATSGRAARVEFPSFQILCRGARDQFDDTFNRAVAAYNAFLTVVNQTIGSGYYQEIAPMQYPFELPVDATFRPRVAFNVHIMESPLGAPPPIGWIQTGWIQ